jgi:hypothetical protein
MSGSGRGVVEQSPRLLDAVGRPEAQPRGEAFFLKPSGDRGGSVIRGFFRIGGIALCPAAT